MNRILTIAAAATLVGGAAFAEAHMEQPEEMTMLSGKVADALAGCEVDLDEEGMMNLTMAQVSGIVIAASSDDGGDACQKIESIAQDNS